MNLTLSEQFIYLAHHPTKFHSVIGSPQRSTAIIGALLLQLFKKKAFTVENKKVIPQQPENQLNQAELLLWERLNGSKRKRTLKTWISKLQHKSERYRNIINGDLEKKEFFRIERKKFLFIPYKRIYVTQPEFHEKLGAHLRKAMQSPEQLSPQERQLLALVKATNLYQPLSRQRKDWKEIRRELKALDVENLVSKDISKTIEEIEAAILISIVTTTVIVAATTTATTSSSS